MGEFETLLFCRRGDLAIPILKRDRSRSMCSVVTIVTIVRFSMSAIIYWQNPCKLPMSFSCIKAYILAFSGRCSRKFLEGISFNFFVCFVFD